MLPAIRHLDGGQFGDGGYQEVHQDVNTGGSLIRYGPQGLRQGVGEEGVVVPVRYMVNLEDGRHDARDQLDEDRKSTQVGSISPSLTPDSTLGGLNG